MHIDDTDRQFLAAVAIEVELVHRVMAMHDRASSRQHDDQPSIRDILADAQALRLEYTRLLNAKRHDCLQIDKLRDQSIRDGDDKAVLERQLQREREMITNLEKAARKREGLVKDMKEVIDEMKAKLNGMREAIECRDATILELTQSITTKDAAFVKKMIDVKRDVGLIVVN